EDADGLGVGAVGEIEAAQTIIRRRKAQPGFCIARMLFDRQAEVLLGETEIICAIMFLAETQFVVWIAAEKAGRRLLARKTRDGAGSFVDWLHGRRSVHRQMWLGRLVNLSRRRCL